MRNRNRARARRARAKRELDNLVACVGLVFMLALAFIMLTMWSNSRAGEAAQTAPAPPAALSWSVEDVQSWLPTVKGGVTAWPGASTLGAFRSATIDGPVAGGRI